MQKIERSENGEIVLKTNLTSGQVAKFNSSISKMIVEDGKAYIPIDELHGVLLTNSRARARTIVTNHADVVKASLVWDPSRFEKHGVSAAIKTIGLCQLLDILAETNPKRATEYRQSMALLTYYCSQHPQLALSSSNKAKHEEAKENSVIRKLKRSRDRCQLSNESFTTEDEKCAHHVEGKSEDPSRAGDEDNLIIIKGSIHDDYHKWLNRQALPTSWYTLAEYAKLNNFAIPLMVKLRTEKADYTELRDLLEAQKWKEADRETADRMLQVAGREDEGWLDYESIEQFPCEDLRTINRLWVKYSNGHFGFSAQKKIWKQVGGKVDRETAQQLADKLGWRVNGKWKNCNKLTFDLTGETPMGYLPAVLLVEGWGSAGWGLLLSSRSL